ncbi:hypothetical protein M0R72_21320 [Candidatus Pacearchaeota archaeon]|jgi:hypothetical protein|nr:hypothetical protein [Candidatus Pacearchaeota archaeon]
MKRYVLFNECKGFFVKLEPTSFEDYESRYSKDINKAAIFDKEAAEYQKDDDEPVEVEVDIRLA